LGLYCCVDVKLNDQTVKHSKVPNLICILEGNLDSVIITGGHFDLAERGVSVVNVHLVGRSDSDSFQDKKVPSINIHSLTNETFPILHSVRDQMSAIHMPEYYDSYRLLTAYLAYLDEKLDPAAVPRL
jgi:hypothetical protein